MKHVTFEIAKLLKEKGFNDGADYWYSVEGSLYHVNEFNNCSGYIPDHSCDAPTISDVIDWIYEKHGIWILVDWMTRTKPYHSGFYSHLRGTSKRLNSDNLIVINNTEDLGYEIFHTPQEAYLAGIEYTLNNLI